MWISVCAALGGALCGAVWAGRRWRRRLAAEQARRAAVERTAEVARVEAVRAFESIAAQARSLLADHQAGLTEQQTVVDFALWAMELGDPDE